MMASAGFGAIGVMIGQAIGGGLGAEVSGGDFWQGAKGGAIGGIVGAGMEAFGVNSMLGDAFGGEIGGIASSAIRGGITSEASGGDFLQGALTGGAMQWANGSPQATQPQATTWSGGETAPGSGTGWGGQTLANPVAADATDLGGWAANNMQASDGAQTMTFGTAGAPQANFANALAQDYQLTPQAMGGASMSNAMPAVQAQAASMPQGNSLSDAFGKLTDAFKQMAKGGGGGTGGSTDMKAALLSTGSNLYMNQQNQKQAEQLAKQADPYAQFRAGDAQQMNALMQDPSSIYKDPGYLAAQRQGQQALMRQGAAQGKVDSGQLSQGLFDQGSQLATQWYNNRMQQLGQTSGASQSPAVAPQVYSNARNTGYLQNALYNPGLLYGRS
jgi:hypothetical protein